MTLARLCCVAAKRSAGEISTEVPALDTGGEMEERGGLLSKLSCAKLLAGRFIGS